MAYPQPLVWKDLPGGAADGELEFRQGIDS